MARHGSLPTVLLYDTRGLRLFEEITYLDEYYLTNAEIEVLTAHARTIAERMPDNAQLIELGSGNLRKIEILLKEFERIRKEVDYYALDLSLEELNRTFAAISPQTYQHVRFHGLHGTYDDALSWLQNPDNRKQPTCVLSMGSSLGNFRRPEAAEFLGRFARLLGSSDSVIVGLDACKDRDKVYRAYNDSKGVTSRFYLNGLSHANAVLGYEAFKPGQWEVVCSFDEANGCHQAFYVPTQDVTINGISLRKGEKILFEEAFKYDLHERERLWRDAGLVPAASFGNSSNDYHIHMLSPASFSLPTDPREYVAHSVPTLQEWRSLWTAWDIVTKSMTPQEELLSKPIKLRNALIFYLGHIPTFLDIHLTRGTRGKPTEPKSYQLIFERGIDPDVDNPEQCHAHSEIPDEWPPLGEILDYQERVRSRVQSIMKTETDGLQKNNRLLGEALWVGFEHEAMHLETFLYMLLQSDRTLPPPGVSTPDFEGMAREARKNAKPNKWFSIPQQTFTIGLHDVDHSKVPEQSFGWDNEKPQRVVTVPAFEAQGRPITNGEYAKYLEVNQIRDIPASWMVSAPDGHGAANGNHHHHHVNGESHASDDFISKFSVRTVFGPVPLVWALDWPVIASYDELAGYARWMNCRLPTFEEVKSIYKYSQSMKAASKENGVLHVTNGGMKSNGTNGHTHTDDVGESYHERNPPKSRAPDHQPVQPSSSSTDRMPVFIDLDGCNVGFKHWHPIPVTPEGDKLAGQGELGGVWEWTSSPLTPHEGFEAMEIYPGYTADFFDGKHYIVLGGSWATHPRIAGRTTFTTIPMLGQERVWCGMSDLMNQSIRTSTVLTRYAV
ncbi:N-methyltransferase [Rasamsonia emersonii CBS 393.64]|uniref:N-methyltransferase n=1 Tax=Rasamsonia emersonii (strain ATCC 16479 / CBS 393.64 / IMI 116815) TaxID=1408163 RepID=A0A0F4YEM9_RASE3|nr:N-methyltransferase [Rasamsonia emersonii CBS 393.64]KKA16396.1 N-methyltransferase [Rasamsonia emersonii CBS 393.64]